MGYTAGGSAVGGVASGALAFTGGGASAPGFYILAAVLIMIGIALYVVARRRNRRDSRAVGIS